jgi:hypothetical protein
MYNSLFFRSLDNKMRMLHAYAYGFAKYFQSGPAEWGGRIFTVI